MSEGKRWFFFFFLPVVVVVIVLLLLLSPIIGRVEPIVPTVTPTPVYQLESAQLNTQPELAPPIWRGLFVICVTIFR